jgi:two-component system, chemotaxis family, protein-glutamate methylesterase/glutaminase
MDRVVVIGASAGGVESLREVVRQLPADFPAPVLAVLHVPAYQPSSLPGILSSAGPLPASHPDDGTVMKAGHIYVAPPDCHLLVDDDRLVVTKGPRENRFRPSIDALFRSAAYNYGSRVMGVVLSGALDDGTSGLWTIKRLGGIAIVQKPNDARFESMPLSALANVHVDHELPAGDIGTLLVRLVSERRVGGASTADDALQKRIATELAIAVEGKAFEKGIMDMGELTPFTCPECHGALVRLKENKMTRYRCHTGHGYSDSALLEAVMETTSDMLWQVMRSLEEGVMLLEHMGRHADEGPGGGHGETYFAKARELQARTAQLHDSLKHHEALSGEKLARSSRER